MLQNRPCMTGGSAYSKSNSLGFGVPKWLLLAPFKPAPLVVAFALLFLSVTMTRAADGATSILQQTGHHLMDLSEPLHWDQLPATLCREIVPVSLITFGALYSVHNLGDNISHSIRKRVDLPSGFDDAAVAGLWGIAALSIVPGTNEERIHKAKQAGETAAWIGATTLVLKESVGRRRPEGSPSAGDRSAFPSGHTAFAFGAATLLSKQWTDPEVMPSLPARLLTRTVLYGTATAVAIGRVDHIEHGFSDVAAGAGLGWLIADLVDAFYQRDRPAGRLTTDLLLDSDHVGLSLCLTW